MLHTMARRAGTAGWVWAALSVAGWARGAGAQENAATLRGVVFDSTEMRALPGARVAVLGTEVAGDTDAEGRFHLPGVPPGTYWVSFFHPRLQSLGVSPSSRQISFSEGAVVEVELAVPSELTLLLGWCSAEHPSSDFGALAGVVVDSITGVPLPRARVRATPVSRGAGDPPPVETRADQAGWYRLCGVPAGTQVTIQPQFGRTSGVESRLVLGRGEGRIHDLVMTLSSEGVLTGRVVDYATREPLQGALVTALGTDARALSGADGTFVLSGLPPGRHLVRTEFLGREPRSDSVTIFSDETVDVEVRLTADAIEIEGLVVTTRSRLGEPAISLARRADVLTRPEIEAVLPRVQGMADLLRAVRSSTLQVREIMVAQGSGAARPGICVEVGRRMTRTPGGCVQAAVFLNGMRVPLGDQVLMSLDPNTVHRIEVLSPMDAQFQFGDAGANGAVLIFTR